LKGILLVGGSGSRLAPITEVLSKHMIPVFNKPLAFYSLSTIMLSGIKEVLIISTKRDISGYQRLFGDGKQLGMRIYYAIQDEPNGIAEAFIIGEQFINGDNVCLSLGDNIIYGQDLSKTLQDVHNSIEKSSGATIFGYRVKDPERYGVVETDDSGRVVSIEEKPEKPRSNVAIIGLYFYDSNVVEIAKNLNPSARGELEITDVNKEYMMRGKLCLEVLGRGCAWLDCGTTESLLEASNFVSTIEHRQNFKISAIEEVAYRMKFIDRNQLINLGNNHRNKEYGSYLLSVANETKH